MNRTPKKTARSAPSQQDTPRGGHHNKTLSPALHKARSEASIRGPDTDDECDAIGLNDMRDKCLVALETFKCEDMDIVPITPAEQSAVADMADEVNAELTKLLGACTKAEQQLRRRKAPSANALDKVAALKLQISYAGKVVGSLKGVKVEWSQVMLAWRNLSDEHMRSLNETAAVVAHLMKREAMEAVRFSKFEMLKPLLSLDSDTFGLAKLISQASTI